VRDHFNTLVCNLIYYHELNSYYHKLSLGMKGYVTPVPADYADLPQLRGRATVEMILKKPNGEQFDIEGALFKEAKMKMIIDGYTGKRTFPL